MQLPQEARSAAKTSKRPRLTQQFVLLQRETIAYFARFSPLLGQPRLVVERRGLLFSSARPPAVDDVIERLGLSKASASQGANLPRVWAQQAGLAWPGADPLATRSSRI